MTAATTVTTFNIPHPHSWTSGQSKRVLDVANAPGGNFFSLLDETECTEERVLRVWWDEIGAYARQDRDVAFIRIIASNAHVAESGPDNGYYYYAPVQGLAVRIPPGRARVDVRFNNTGAAISETARVYARMDPGRVTYRRTIAQPLGIIGFNDPAATKEYDSHSDPNARYAAALVVQTFGIGTVDLIAPSGTTYSLGTNQTYYVDARGKITLNPTLNTAGFNVFWDVYE